MIDWHYLDADSSHAYELYPLSEFTERLPSGEYRLFTDAELRARDERIIRAAFDWPGWPSTEDIDAIIAAAEADE